MPTYRDIAKAAGVSVAAVSFALRKSRKVSEKTRQRVQRVAQKLGYQPNPLLAAYQASVRTRKLVKYQATLAWINDHPEARFWTGKSYNVPYLDGAKQRARQLGYGLDEIWLPDLDLDNPIENLKRFQQVLRARGIHGVILPMPMLSHHGVLEWEGRAVVLMGENQRLMQHARQPLPASVQQCQHHQVNPDHFHNVVLALRGLTAAGYQRIGLFISPWYDQMTDGLCAAGFWSEQRDLPEERRVPVELVEKLEDLPAWLKRHRPDAVIGYQSELRPAIEAAGLRIPRDIGLAHLNLAPDVAGWSGIDQQPELISSAAVDLVTAHLQRNERGRPPFAKETLIKGRWVEGKTTRRQAKGRG